MKIVIKKSTDAEDAYKIAEKLHGTFFNDQGMEEIKKALSAQFIAAFDEEKMVGFITFKEINPEAVELSYIAVDPDYQDKGVGTQLVEEGLKMQDKNYKVCEVKTLADTAEDEGYEKTRNFYKKLGFIPLEIINPYPGWGEENPCQILVKFL